MGTDPLAPYRRPGTASAAPPDTQAPQGATGGYRAYGLASGTAKPMRLEIRPKGDIAVARSYAALSEILYDRTHYASLWLVFPGIKLTVKGTDLKPIVEALLAGTCEWMAELQDGETAQLGQAVITSITGTPTTAPPVRPASNKES